MASLRKALPIPFFTPKIYNKSLYLLGGIITITVDVVRKSCLTDLVNLEDWDHKQLNCSL